MTAQFMPGMGLFPALVLAVLASVFVGCISGFFVGRLKLQAMVITLGMQLAVRGVSQVLCGGRDIYFNKLGEVGKQLSVSRLFPSSSPSRPYGSWRKRPCWAGRSRPWETA